MQRSTLLLLFFLALNSAALRAQELIEAVPLGSLTKDQMVAQFGSIMQYGVDYYQIKYTTSGLDGSDQMVSGLLAAPQDPGAALAFPFLVYQHGTAGSKDDVPSFLSAEAGIAQAAAGLGYFALAPDYLGLGISPVVHPYVHAASEAWAAIDMLYAVQDFLSAEDRAFNDGQVFVTGYSQGGHASMALHRELEANYVDEFPVAAAAHLSGPYSVSEVMRDFTLGDDEYFTPSYMVYIALGYQQAYGIYDNIEEFFHPNYLPAIQEYQAGMIDLWELNGQLIDQLTQDHGGSYPKYLLQDSILNALFNEPQHPASLALADNDVYDWTPTAPTRLFYCQADEQVSYENALVAKDQMIANGSTSVLAVDLNPNFGHVDCVEPAINTTFFIFGLYQQILQVSANEEILAGRAQWQIAPNPSSGLVQLSRSGFQKEEVELQIFDALGRLQDRQSLQPSASLELDLSDLAPGCYFLELRSESGREIHRLVID